VVLHGRVVPTVPGSGIEVVLHGRVVPTVPDSMTGIHRPAMRNGVFPWRERTPSRDAWCFPERRKLRRTASRRFSQGSRTSSPTHNCP
jgi:hypothetical protein